MEYTATDERPIRELPLSKYTATLLINMGLSTIGELVAAVENHKYGLANTRHIGRKRETDIMAALGAESKWPKPGYWRR